MRSERRATWKFIIPSYSRIVLYLGIKESMKALAKASRVNTALQVIQRMNNGMTIIDACREVGVPRSTFYDICKRNPEAVAKVQEIIEANAQQQLGLILSHKTEILQKVISDGLADTTKPKDRLAIYKTLSELLDGLT